jgi:hypothetical protein
VAPGSASEFVFISRRSWRTEIDGTPGYAIITETQERIIPAKARERDEMRREGRGSAGDAQGFPTAGKL